MYNHIANIKDLIAIKKSYLIENRWNSKLDDINIL